MTEQEALAICREKVASHGLEMKLVDCKFDTAENKTTFYFTADGRVDFRELVKDLAAVFRNRIELRQIGVRDEAKMLGGIGICGRPYCCREFLNDFAPVSTKMAKVQSLSLNPTKISGACGRLMCCLRYEEDAYEELIRTVPKQGAYVETPDGYGTAIMVNLLQQTVKVALDGDAENPRLYRAKAVAAVPGGRPKTGETPPHVLNYDPSEDEEELSAKAEEDDFWTSPQLFAEEQPSEPEPQSAPEESAPESPEKAPSGKSGSGKKHHYRGRHSRKPKSKGGNAK